MISFSELWDIKSHLHVINSELGYINSQSWVIQSELYKDRYKLVISRNKIWLQTNLGLRVKSELREIKFELWDKHAIAELYFFNCENSQLRESLNFEKQSWATKSELWDKLAIARNTFGVEKNTQFCVIKSELRDINSHLLYISQFQLWVKQKHVIVPFYLTILSISVRTER